MAPSRHGKPLAHATQAAAAVECVYDCTDVDDPTRRTQLILVAQSQSKPATIVTDRSVCVLSSCRIVPSGELDDPI